MTTNAIFKYMRLNFLFLICIIFSISGIEAKGFLRTDGAKIINDNGEVLLRGIGLGGWILQEPYMLQLSGVAKNQIDIRRRIHDLIGEEKTSEFYAAWVKNGVQKADIDSLAKWGFNSVRLPMHYNLYTLPIEKEPKKGENTWLESGFLLTDSILSWCKANEMYLILDLHAAPGGQGNDLAISDASDVKLWNSAQNKTKTVALWKKLADRYKNEEWIGGYDILNEPNWGFQDSEDLNGNREELNAPLRQLYIDITKAIREVDQKHFIVISGNAWGNNYKGIFPLWDDNMVISFHKYWTYNDDQSITNFLEYRNKYNAPLWMSESGENSNTWHTNAIKLFEHNDIGWCWWTYKKMGFNCVMEIPTNPEYEKTKAYWRGEGERPTPEDAYKGLMQLADDYKVENTHFKKDYIDALFRQVKTTSTKPFHNLLLKEKTPLIINATDFDLGRNGYAYFDKDTADYWVSSGVKGFGNKGRVYRNDGVDIMPSDDSASNGYCIFSIEPDEWLQYTFSARKQGGYKINISTQAVDGEGSLYLVINGRKTPIFKTSGSTADWNVLEVKGVNLKKGINTIKVHFVRGGFKMSRIEIKR